MYTQHKNGGPLDTYTLASLHYLPVFRITEFNYIYIDKIKFELKISRQLQL